MFRLAFVLASLLPGASAMNSCLRLGETVTAPYTVLSDIDFTGKFSLETFESTQQPDNSSLDTSEQVYKITATDTQTQEVILEQTFNGTTPVEDTNTSTFMTEISLALKVSENGRREISLKMEAPAKCSTVEAERISTATHEIRAIPAVLSIFPALITVVLAILTRQVLPSLYLGVYIGCLFLYNYNPITAFARSLDTKVVEAVADFSHAVVLLFSWMLAGMVAVISKSGGARGLAAKIVEKARNSRGGLMASVGMGFLIFFDDYANTLIVGNTIRPITDQLRVSHEKLAFIVDGTAAPLASIAPISSWIGFELSLIKDGFKDIGLDKSPYIAFLETIPGRFYPVLLLVFVIANVGLHRDFGPMLTAERRARETGQLSAPKEKKETKEPDAEMGDTEETGEPLVRESYKSDDFYASALKNDDKEYDGVENELLSPKPGVELRWYNAFVPIVMVILSTFFGLIIDGVYAIKELPEEDREYSIKEIFSSADSFHVLMWSGFIGLIVPVIMYSVQKIMTPMETLHIWVLGMAELMEPVLILVLAWTLGSVMKELMFSDWLVNGLKDNISATYLSTVVFLLSAIISFCTGTSWGTMTIMIQLVVNLAWEIGGQDYNILILNIASVLSGAVFGDHCSPISDTTVLSSLATKCDVSDHVKTQSPYAIIVAIVGILVGNIPSAATSNYHPAIGLVIGSIILVAILFVLGKPVDIFVLEDPTKLEEVPVGVAKDLSKDVSNDVSRDGDEDYKGLMTPK